MNDLELHPLSPSAPGLQTGDSADVAHLLASEIKARWDNGERADAWSVLADHPEWLASKSIVLDLAYEEYCQRTDLGESIDSAQFCQRFPNYRQSLRRLIDVHRYLEENPQLLADESAVRWPEVGDTLLGFRLIEQLGRGAFARVFLAAETALGQRRVAVKVAVQGSAEAQTLGRLNHPNIVPVNSVQFDESTGLTAICMPFLGDQTLCDVLEVAFGKTGLPTRSSVIVEAVRPTTWPDGTPLDPPDPLLRDRSYAEGVVHLIAQLAEALAYAHSTGVCHLDLKPSNILVTPTGRPLLLDFNLSTDERNASQVCAGGTVPYMSPEQLLAIGPASSHKLGPPGAQSDIFSLGVILYEMIGGSLPFGPLPERWQWEELRDELLMRQKAGPRPLPPTAQVDPSLAELVTRCLSFDPHDRPRSAQELANALRRYLSPWQRARRLARARRRVVLAGACVVMGVAIAGLYALAVRDPYSVRQLQRGLIEYRHGNFRAAIKHLNESVEADPNLASAFFLRGRAYQQVDDVTAALPNYMEANRLAPDGSTFACVGYCHSLLDSHGPSIWNYEKAIENGFAPAAVLNNLGYGYGQVHREADASHYLDQAIDLDPRLQAAYYNRAMIQFRRAIRAHEPIPTSAIADMQEAVRLGPVTAELLRDTSRVYAMAAREDPACVQLAVEYLRKAIDLGQDPSPLESDSTFEAVLDVPQFVAEVQRPPSGAVPQRALRVVDPVSRSTD